jgi:asparagine synthase (glutamine-hydrolysing)
MNGRLWITFNGEIFNYLELREELIRKGYDFATCSDTEVILNSYREYGERCVDHFNGQWAFAIWDQDRQSLFLSRDRLGVRPLFYCKTGDGLLFASEIKALIASGEVSGELDLYALDQIFTFWVTLPPRTAFREVQQLPPGHSMTLKDGKLQMWQYWSLSYEEAEDLCDCSEKKLAEDLLNLALDATRIRLRSDVPVGAYLSGGIDSTFIAALAKPLVNENLRTFSVAFEDTEYDESPYQRTAIDYLGTKHSEVRCGNGDIARTFPDVIRHTEQPVIRTAPAPLYILAKLVRENGFKVVLTGEGADEILGGYDIYKEAKIRQFWARQRDSKWRPLLLKRLYPYMEGMHRQSAVYFKNFFYVASDDVNSPFFSHMPRWQLTAKLKMFFSAETQAALKDYDALDDITRMLPAQYFAYRPFARAEYLETVFLLPGYILSSQGDRMAMAHSVEARFPFLDYRMVEFAAKLPPPLKMKVLDQKHLLKIASNGLIPEVIRKRPKQPYRAPDGKCFFGKGEPDYVKEVLSEDSIRKTSIFDPALVSALIKKFRQGHALGTKDNMALVGILSTQLLVDKFTMKRG